MPLQMLHVLNVIVLLLLSVQAMVDELYFNINAESDILALAYYEPFSLR